MRVAEFFGYLVAAVLVHVFGAHLLPAFPRLVDLFLVLVVFNGLRSGLAGALLGGAVAGLTADALIGGGFYGMHGFADTLTGYLTAYSAQRFVVQRTNGYLAVFIAAAFVQQIVLLALRFVVLPAPDWHEPLWIVARALVTGFVAILLGVAKQRITGGVAIWRHRHASRLRLDQ